MKTKLKTITMKDIQEYGPCYSPLKYAGQGWSGTVLTILNNSNVPTKDRLWVVLRNDLLSDRILRLFAVSCARKALTLVKNPDPRSVNACNVAERFANGKATAKELEAARSDAAAAAATADAAAAYAAADAAAAAAAYAAAAAADAADAGEKARREQIKQLIKLIKEEYDA